jgi:hypothetical protein
MLLIVLFDAFSTLKVMWADTGYKREAAGHVRKVRRRDHRRGRRPHQPALELGLARSPGERSAAWARLSGVRWLISGWIP